MSNKFLCLVLTFRDAKTFHREPFKKDAHCMVENSGWNARAGRSDAWIDVPPDTLSVHHVSNVIHVLAGERPVPTLRVVGGPCSPKRSEHLFSLASDAFVKVTEGLVHGKDGNLGVYKEEALMTRKCHSGSTMPLGMDKFVLGNMVDPRSKMITWDRAKYSMGLSAFAKFIEMAESVLGLEGITSKQSLHATLVALRSSRSPVVAAFLQENDLRPPTWSNLITTGEADLSGLKTGYRDANYFMAYTVSRGKESVSVRSGEIYVPISAEDKALLQNGPGWATLLEGGVVSIKEIRELSPRMLSNAKPVFNKGASV